MLVAGNNSHEKEGWWRPFKLHTCYSWVLYGS